MNTVELLEQLQNVDPEILERRRLAVIEHDNGQIPLSIAA